MFVEVTSWYIWISPYTSFGIVGEPLFWLCTGSDVNPLGPQLGAIVGELRPDSQRYFDIHHSRADVLENVNKRELEFGALNMAALIYLVDKYGF